MNVWVMYVPQALSVGSLTTHPLIYSIIYVNVSVETCSYMLHAVSLRFLFKRAHGFCRGLSPSTSKKSRAKVDSNGSIACSLLGGLLELHVRWYYCLATKQLWLMLEFFVVSKSSSPSPDPPQKQVQAYTLQYHLKHHLIPPFTSSLEHTLPFQVPLPLSSSGWGGSQSWSERSSNVMRCHAVSWRQWKGTRRKDTHIQDEEINATPCWQIDIKPITRAKDHQENELHDAEAWTHIGILCLQASILQCTTVYTRGRPWPLQSKHLKSRTSKRVTKLAVFIAVKLARS